MLTATWLLGEAAIVPMGAAVVMMTWLQRDRRFIGQATIAFGLLAVYVAYQRIFIHDASLPQRFIYIGPSLENIGAALRLLWKSGKAVLGQSYYDGELQTNVATTGPFKTSLTPLIAALVFVIACLVSIRSPRSRGILNLRLGLVFSTRAPLSIALYLALTSSVATGFAVRQAAAFYALLPLGFITLAAVSLPERVTRIVAGSLAALTLALSIGLLYRAEVLVNRPNRAFIAQLQPHTAIVAHHAAWDMPPDGRVIGGYPGLISPYQNGLANPLRLAWITRPALEYYGITYATACHKQQGGRIAVYFQGVETVFDASAVKAVGLTSHSGFEVQELSVADVCTE